MSRAARATTLVALLLPAAQVAAQPPPQTERVDVTRVLVDARVVDDAGAPLRDLGPEDFTATIDKRPVRVESVEWIGGGAGAGTLPSTARAGLVEPATRGRLVVVVVQKSLERHRILGLLRLVRESERLFAGLTPADRVAIVSFDTHLKIWLDFTDDLDRARRVLEDDVLFRAPRPVEPATGWSLLARLRPERGRRTYRIEEALELLGVALEPLPGSKSVVLIGYGFGELTVSLGRVGARLDPGYARARAALAAARAAVFCLDVTDADYHTFEHGLQTVADDTGGFYARTHLFAARAVERVAHALAGHYVLFLEAPPADAGLHRLEVALSRHDGRVFARRTYVD